MFRGDSILDDLWFQVVHLRKGKNLNDEKMHCKFYETILFKIGIVVLYYDKPTYPQMLQENYLANPCELKHALLSRAYLTRQS